MSPMRFTSRLVCLVTLLTVVSSAPGKNVFQPFGPVDFETDAQPFAFADLTDFALGDKTRQGVTFTYERLHWMMTRPPRTPVGKAGLAQPGTSGDGISFITQFNSVDTSVPGSGFTWGNRFDLGYADGRGGWMLGILSVNDQQQEFIKRGATVNFTNPAGTFGTALSGFTDLDGNAGFDDDIDGDGIFGRYTDSNVDGIPDTLGGAGTPDLGDAVIYPTQFSELTARNITRTNGVELMKMFRLRQLPSNSTVELFFGVRYMELQDAFQITALGGFANGGPDALGVVPDPAVSYWNTEVDNDMIGPQVAGRWYARNGPWNIAIDGRFFAAWNFQNVEQVGQIGRGLVTGPQNPPAQNQPATLDTSDFEHFRRFQEWSPSGEIRVETSYQFTKAIALKVGWTGFYAAGIGRASNLVDYRLPDMGILSTNRSNFYSHGVNFGVEVNR